MLIRASALRIITTFFVAISLNWIPQVANANEIKKPNWLASCPEVLDLSPQLPTPKTKTLIFQNSGQSFTLLKRGLTEAVSEPSSVIGCYVVESAVTNPNQSPAWQIGSLSRDLNGYYFKNAAGITWRLKLSANETVFEIAPGSTYFSEPGLGFRIDAESEISKDCKVPDNFMGPLRLGFPRNKERVPSLGETSNLIIVFDYPDAPFNGDLRETIRDVFSPEIVSDFFRANSYGKLNLRFDVHPKVVRISSPEASFAPNPSGGFYVNGVQQDHRLMTEVLAVANQQADLRGYTSFNFFAPTGKSLGYYGSAHLGLKLRAGAEFQTNSQMINGGIGTIKSMVPSWKVVAHEYGHLLGLYDFYIAGTGNSGRSPGPFDLMGNTSGSANTFLGLNRWVQGWLNDNDVYCELGEISETKLDLKPLNSNLGTRLYVKQLTSSTAVFAEYRTNTNYDNLGTNSGVLVYLVDFTVPTGQGSIQILHSEGDKTASFQNDNERYAAATLTQEQHVKIANLVISADKITEDSAQITVRSDSHWQKYQAQKVAEAEAAADLKARLEAEAKIKAAEELRAKQEAEAKLAADKSAADAANKLKKTTIFCTKGKLTKKVVAKKPKCPAGFKRR